MKIRRWAIALIVPLLLLLAAGSVSGQLIDMAGHWSAPLIAALRARGVVTGDPQGRFLPDAPLTRAQMARMLVSAMGRDADAQLLAAYPSRFRDVGAGDWARGYVEALAESAITEGFPDGTFAPEESVSRAQMAAFLVRAAGLSEVARQWNQMPTRFADDQQIPPWARGAVNMSVVAGLMQGFEDNRFRPMQPITRAEGGAALLRLLGYQGAAYHLTGTLTRFDPFTGTGSVRDALGQERAFQMAAGAQYYRNGTQVSAAGLRLLDQVWVVLGAEGTGQLMDARFAELLARGLTVEGGQATLRLADGTERLHRLQAGALLFLNGRPVRAEALSDAALAYALLDQVTGEIRVLDAVRPSLQGIFLGFDGSPPQAPLVLAAEGQVRAVPLAADLLIFIDGRRAQPSDLQAEQTLLLALNEAGEVTYVQVVK